MALDRIYSISVQYVTELVVITGFTGVGEEKHLSFDALKKLFYL